MLWLIVSRAMRVTFFAALLLLLGCASAPTPNESLIVLPKLDRYLSSSKVGIATVSEITQLPQQAQAEFWAFFNQPKFSTTPRHERVASYLSLLMDQFQYSERTYTASQTLAAKSGNCLSLSLLTTAYAELASVDISYHLLERNPIFAMRSNFLVESSHIRAVLTEELASSTEGIKLEQKIIVDFFDSSGYHFHDHLNFSDHISLYYSNRAAELLIEGRHDEAFAHVEKAIELTSNNMSAINTAAILLKRSGDVTSAEQFYEYGLASERRLLFLKNYIDMLVTQGQVLKAQALQRQYSMDLKRSPGFWISEARHMEKDGNLSGAVSNYQKALVLAPDLHQLHFRLGTINRRLGNSKQATQNLNDAIALTDSARQRSKYKLKNSQWKKKPPN